MFSVSSVNCQFFLRNISKEVPPAIGIGVAFGSANRLTTENGSYDYSGLTVHYAAKLQTLARPRGGVVITDNWKLPTELHNKFSEKGKMLIGDEWIPVRATEGVEFGTGGKNGSPMSDHPKLN